MATIVTRAGKGSALTFQEADDNFVNLNADGTANSASIANLQNDKLDKSGGTVTGPLTVNANLIAGGKVLGSTSNNSQSGTSITVSAPSTEIVRLTNVLLTSISGITAGSSGQKLVLVNRTGTTITIENESPSATSSQDQVYTGSGGSLLLNDKASISLVYDSTTSRWNIIGGTGSGSGSSGINYILNPDASVGLTGYSVYNDSAAAPVDGSGGTAPAGLFVRSTTSPLRGSGDFNIVKTGLTSYEGAGVAYDFTIDNADLAKVLTVTFDYEVVSGTYVTGDFTVYLIQDPAGTPVVIQPAGYQIQGATVGTKMKQIATFQTASNVNSYRLCFHCATTSPLDYTLALDSISVGPQVVQYGAPVTDWVSYTPTITTSSGTMTNYTATGKYRRVGDQLEFNGTILFSGSVGTWSDVYVQIPSGLSIDSSKLSTTSAVLPLGIATALDSGVAAYPSGQVRYASATTVQLNYTFTNTSDAGSSTDPAISGIYSNLAPLSFAANDRILWQGSVPILGWSSTVQMSNDTDTRVVAANVYASGSDQTIGAASSAKLTIYNTISVNTHGSFSSGTFTVPVPGYYKIFASCRTNAAASALDKILQVYKNNLLERDLDVLTSTGYWVLSGSIVLYLNAGDTIDIRVQNGQASSVVIYGTVGNFSVERLSGPSAIAASETVAFVGQRTAGNYILNNSSQTITWSSVLDTHGGYSGTTYTVPVSGLYEATTHIPVTGASGNVINMNLFMGSVVKSAWTAPDSANPNYRTMMVSCIARLNAGQQIYVNVFSPVTAGVIADTTSVNGLNIKRIGN